MKTRSTIKYIAAVLLVFAACAGCLVFLSYLFRPVSESRKNICGFYAEKKDSLDMVYIGGSVCYNFWEGLQAWHDYGFTSYNFATDAVQAQVLKYEVEEVLKTQTPSLFVIDLRPFQYGDSWNEEEGIPDRERVAPFRNVADNMRYSANRARLIRDGAPSGEEEWTYHFDFAKYHSLVSSLFSAENWRYADNSEYLYTKGFSPHEGVLRINWTDMSGIEEEQRISEELDAVFISLLEYCRSRDLTVLFVVQPYQQTEEDVRKYRYLSRVISEYGFDCLNANDHYDAAGFDSVRDFNDYNHVNILGADKYTAFLASYLKRHYELPDHRGEAGYRNWDESYERWAPEMEEIRARVLASEPAQSE